MKKLLAFDQASITTGYSYFEDEELKYVGHFTCKESDFGDRLTEFRNHIIELLDKYNPDEVVFEDIQLQKSTNKVQMSDVQSVTTFKKLAEIFGVLYELVSERNIPNSAVIPNVWKATFKIAGKGRSQEKKMAQEWVLKTYGLKCTEDEADSVCIGSHTIKKQADEFNWS